jgi:hypothetical protein
MVQFAAQRIFRKVVFLSVIWIILSPICFHLIILDDFSSISQYLSYEATDQDDSETIFGHKEKLSIPAFVVKHLSEVHPFFEHIPSLSLGNSVPCSRPLYLRC